MGMYLARRETLPRFRRVGFETKDDGTPVTEADKAAERAIRQRLGEAFPDYITSRQARKLLSRVTFP